MMTTWRGTRASLLSHGTDEVDGLLEEDEVDGLLEDEDEGMEAAKAESPDSRVGASVVSNADSGVTWSA